MLRPRTRLYGVVSLVCTVLLLVALAVDSSITQIGLMHRVVGPS
jgi:hypothetical protein